MENLFNGEYNNLESSTLGKDNKELEDLRQRSLLKFLATTNLAFVAPYLSLARMADKETNKEMMVTIRVQGINFLTREGYTVVRMCTSTDIDKSDSQKNIENTLYTYRNLSAQVFEPFVYIGRTSERKEVLAYSDEREFLASEVNGDDKAVLQEVKKIAAEKEMRSLARFVDLIEQAINTATL